MDKPIIPEGAHAGKSVRGNYIGGYADVVQVYLERGWVSVLPLPPGQKSPPPTGFTGRGAQIPTPEQVENWRRERRDADVALALVVCDDWEYDLVGVDVDNYAKGSRPAGRAMEAIAETEGRAGVRFPVTPSLEHRDDGSGIWVYRVPKGLFWRSQLGTGVELIHKGHRYIAAGRHKHWKDAEGQPLNEPPRPQDCAELPHELVLELMREDNGTELRGLATPGAAKELLDGLPDGVMNVGVRELMNRALNDLSGLNGARHDRTLSHVRDLVKYGAAGLTGTHTALGALRADFVEAVWDDPERGSREVAAAEFDRMRMNGGQLAAAKSAEELALFGVALKALAPGGLWHPDTLWSDNKTDTTNSRYRLVSARELAEPVRPMRWLVRGIWPERSAGVLAGDKKSMKTWNLQALAIAVAAGTALFDRYHVTSAGPVLYLCGEGGRDTFANRHQVIADRYGITEMLPELAFGAEFGVGMLTDSEFTDAVKRHLDTLQPKLVILDPLYAYHPSDVEVQNVYARGPMLVNLRELIGGEAALVVGDHFNKTAGSRLDLDNIAQAGMAQWADSWILQKHRETPNLYKNKFWLEVETGTRRGGGKHAEVDWTLERDQGDPDVIMWTGVDWDARAATVKSAVGQADNTVVAILQVVADHPYELTQTQVLKAVGDNREKAIEAFQGLKANSGVVVKNCAADENGRPVNRDRVGLGQNAERLRNNRYRRPQPESTEATDTDDGTGSERVTR